MNFAIVLFCVILSIPIHELGHAFAMLRHGVKIERICLLGFGPKLFEFRLTRWFGDVPIELRLFPLGASVMIARKQPNNKSMRDLPFITRSEIAGAGVINDMVMACLYIFIANMCYEYLFGIQLRQTLAALACLIIGFVCLKWQRWISPIIPFIGALMIGITLALILQGALTTTEALSGPIETVKDIRKESVTFKNIHEAFGFAGVITFSIGLLNCFPIFPLDGGQIADAWIKKLLGEKRYARFETPITIALSLPGAFLIIFVLGHDLYKFILDLF